MSCFYSVGSAVENDDFGDFAAFRTGSPTQKHLSDDAFFTEFQSNTVLQVKYIESSHFRDHLNQCNSERLIYFCLFLLTHRVCSPP